MNGEKIGGITIMYMKNGIDTGDIILQKPIDIPETMTAGEYHDIMSQIGSEAIIEVMQIMMQIKYESIKRIQQDDSKATYAAKLEKAEFEINFNNTSTHVINHIRGLSPYPGAFTFVNGKRFKIFNAVKSDGTGEIGKIINASSDNFEIACNGGSIIVTDIQPEGSKRMSVQAYLVGHSI